MRKWLLFIMLAFLSTGLLTGCGNVELERKEFPLTLGLDVIENGGSSLQVIYNMPDLSKVTEQSKETGQDTTFKVEGVNLKSAQEEYLRNTNKKLDYSQLKAIIISHKVLEEQTLFEGLLTYLEGHNAISQSVMVFVSDSPQAVIEAGSKKEGSLGIYLEKLMSNQEKGERKVTVGNLITHWRNQNEILLIPVLEKYGNSEVRMEKAVVLKNNKAVGELEKEELEVIQLSKGKTINKVYYFDGCPEISVRNARVSYDIGNTETDMSNDIKTTSSLPVVTVKIVLKAEMEENILSNEQEVEDTKKRIETQMKEKLELLEMSWGQKLSVDLWNTYIMLGRRNRTLWRQYNQKQNLFEKDRKMNFVIQWTGI